MNQTPRTNESWDIVFRDITIGSATIDDTATDVAVTYTLVRNRVTIGSGSLAWEDHGYTDAWVKRITLPSTPGPLTVKVQVSATIDAATATGSDQTSIDVVTA